jgi:hypothetical protein
MAGTGGGNPLRIDGLAMLIQCPPDGADACFAALDP